MRTDEMNKGTTDPKQVSKIKGADMSIGKIEGQGISSVNKPTSPKKSIPEHNLFSFFTVGPETRKTHLEETKKEQNYMDDVHLYLRGEIDQAPHAPVSLP